MQTYTDTTVTPNVTKYRLPHAPYSQLTTLYFPPTNVAGEDEKFEWYIQIGDERIPQYANRACERPGCGRV